MRYGPKSPVLTKPGEGFPLTRQRAPWLSRSTAFVIGALVVTAAYVVPLSREATNEAARAARLEMAYRACMGPRLPVVW